MHSAGVLAALFLTGTILASQLTLFLAPKSETKELVMMTFNVVTSISSSIVAIMSYQEGRTFIFFQFAVCAGLYAYLAYRRWSRRRRKKKQVLRALGRVRDIGGRLKVVPAPAS